MKCKGFEPSIIQETEEYININKIAKVKGLTSKRSLGFRFIRVNISLVK